MSSPLSGNSLPTEIVVGGQGFAIRHDFRDGIRFETMMSDRRIPDQTRVTLALDIWFETRPRADLGAVITGMLDFYRCGKPAATEDSSERVMSYDADWDAIFSGFLSTYRIDLLDPDTRLHWWKFRSMLMALPSDSQLMRIIGYRVAKPYKGMSDEAKSHMRKMARLYALPDDATNRPVRLKTQADVDAALAAINEAKRKAAADG